MYGICSAGDYGQGFDELPESYMIFITQNDVLGCGFPIYHIDRMIQEAGACFMDEAHIIYVNSKRQDDTALGRLMYDLHCKNAEDIYSRILADRVYELKETQEGVKLMCHEMEKIYSEGIKNGEKRGEKRGELKKARETALSMAEEGMDVKLIARLIKVSEKDVQKWILENKSNSLEMNNTIFATDRDAQYDE